MIRPKYIKYIRSIVIIWGFSQLNVGCKAPKNIVKTTEEFHKEIPDTFVRKTPTIDTLSIADIPWNIFFPDSQLVKLIDTALSNNYNLKIAQQKIKVAGAYLLQSKGAFLPTISLAANATGTKYGKYTMDGVGNYDTNLSDNINDKQKVGTNPTPNYWLGANYSWEADIWGKLHDLKSASENQLQATIDYKQLLISSLVAQVAGLYYTLQGLDKEKVYVNENIQLQKDGVKRILLLKHGGRSNELAVQQFQAQLYNTQSIVYDINQRITATENQLNALLGRFGHSVQRTESIKAFDSTLITIGIPTKLLQNRPDIRLADANLQVANANVKAARAAFFPKLELNGYSAFNAFKSSLLFSPGSFAYSLAGNISAPILQKKELKANFNIKTAEQEAAFLEYQQTVLNAYQEVATQFKDWENKRSTLQKKEMSVYALTNSVVTANKLFDGGQAGYLDIFTAQQNKLNAQIEYINAQVQSILSLVNLYQAVGGGWK